MADLLPIRSQGDTGALFFFDGAGQSDFLTVKAISHTHRNRTEKIKSLKPYERFHICAETETEPNRKRAQI